MRHKIKISPKSVTIPIGLWLFLACFAVGVALLNIWGKEHVVSFFTIDSYFFQKVSGMDVPKTSAFLYLLGKRGGLFFLLLIASFTRLHKWVHMFFVSYVGLGFGVIAASFVVVFKGLGVGLFLLSMFPQVLVYAVMYLMILGFARVVQNHYTWEWDSYRGRKMLLLLGMILGIVLLFLFGLFTESYMNPYFLSKAAELMQ